MPLRLSELDSISEEIDEDLESAARIEEEIVDTQVLKRRRQFEINFDVCPEGFRVEHLERVANDLAWIDSDRRYLKQFSIDLRKS